MYTIFYLLSYLAILGFLFLCLLKILEFVNASPIHVRWELYPIPHEGPRRYAYGGSYMQETNWWTKPRHVDHWEDFKALLLEIFCLHNTLENKPKLWLRSYPFHMGLYLLMMGICLVIFAVILQLLGVRPYGGFLTFIGNLVNAITLFGALAIAGGGIALIIRRSDRKGGMHKYTTPQFYANLAGFVLFSLLSLMAWIFNSNFYDVCRAYFYNLFTWNFQPLGSFWFVLIIIVGWIMMLWIPITNMRHILIKYFMWHEIRWGDEATVWSEKNQNRINEVLQYPVTWSAPHIAGDGKPKTWADIAMSNPAINPETPEK